MEHHEPNGGVLATGVFAIISFIFKGGGIVGVDSYILLPLAHLVSIIAGTCAIVSFLFVLHPPLKNGLLNLIEKIGGCIESVWKFVKKIAKW